LADADLERGENSLKSRSMPRTGVRMISYGILPEEAVFLIEFI
jgi:hypothetical protein